MWLNLFSLYPRSARLWHLVLCASKEHHQRICAARHAISPGVQLSFDALLDAIPVRFEDLLGVLVVLLEVLQLSFWSCWDRFGPDGLG